jgi:hypothetical protein
MKIILIDDDQNEFDRFLEAFKDKKIFPENTDVFNGIRSSIYLFFITPKEDLKKECAEDLRKMLRNFKGDDKNVVYIIDFQLNPDDPRVNGLDFYEIFAKGERAFFVSGSRKREEIKRIEAFCKKNPNCSFVPRQVNSIDILSLSENKKTTAQILRQKIDLIT